MTSEKTDVIGLQSLAAKRRILFIASGKLLRLCILQYLQRNDSVSWCTIFSTEIQFLQNLHSICRQSVYRLVHKKIPYAVCWKASNTYKTLISKRRTLGDIAIWLTFRTTRLKVNTESPRDNRKFD